MVWQQQQRIVYSMFVLEPITQNCIALKTELVITDN